MPCHSLRSSCFIDPWGTVFPCITTTARSGACATTDMRLAPIWESADARQLQAEIWRGDCPQCWTACEAYPTLLGHLLRPRQRRPTAPTREPTCHAQTRRCDRGHRGAQRSEDHRGDRMRLPSAGARGHCRRRTLGRPHRRAGGGAGAKVLKDGGRGKGDAIRIAIPHITTPVTVFIDADGSHDPRDIPRLVAPITARQRGSRHRLRLIGGSSELHGGFDEFFRLAGSSFVTACFNWKFGVRLSDSQNGFRAIRTEVLQCLHLGEDYDDDRTGDDPRDAAPRISHGGSAGTRVPRAGSAPRTSASGVRRHVIVWSLLPRPPGPAGPRTAPVAPTAADRHRSPPAGNSDLSRR